ncbi:MAG TPA: helix-turn-helix domain-containing protein [Sedimentisphaerales bacterium]|nr:helix-turn-helix domain-containing protein [Sedimentisphaerales bacterium]
MSERFFKLFAGLASRRDLRATDKVVLSVLRHRVGKNGACWPGVRSLAKDTGLSRPTVLDSICRLEKKEEIKVSRRGSGRKNYYLLITESGQKTLPVQDTESGQVSLLVAKQKRSSFFTTSGQEPLPEAVKNLYHNRIESLKRTSDSVRLAEFLLSEIRRRKPDFRKPDLEAWSKHIDRMLRIDKRTPERIEAVVRWTQQDIGDGGGFGWANNILSAAKLREKFDRLELDMQKRPGLPTAEPVKRGADGLTPRERALKELQND